VRNRIVLVPPVQACGDVMVEHERVPGEPATAAERGGDSLEHAPPVCPRPQVKERTEGAVDEARWFIEFEIAHVALAQIESDPCCGGRRARLREHGRRGVDPDHRPTGRKRHRNRNATSPDRELDEWPVNVGGEAGIERHVLRHPRCPLVVTRRELLVPTHRPSLRAARWKVRRTGIVDRVSFPLPQSPAIHQMTRSQRADDVIGGSKIGDHRERGQGSVVGRLIGCCTEVGYDDRAVAKIDRVPGGALDGDVRHGRLAARVSRACSGFSRT
jgi:hypothetical protein